MSNLFHVTMKEPENSGYSWRGFYCAYCMDNKRAVSTWLVFLKHVRVTPQYLSRLYPPLVNEPVCADCGILFRR
jgi:hypothetical protein